MIPKELLPRPALRIGVTGRRVLTISVPSSDQGPETTVDVTEKIRGLVSEILAVARQAATDEFENSCHFYQDEQPEFRAVSPLAEGADRTFTQEAVKLGYRLECPLPFHRDEYARDFKTPGSEADFHELLAYAGDAVLELNGERHPKAVEDAAYETVGRLVVDQCDLLIAVWDGKADSGVGGTSGIMQFAQGRVPVICLRMDEAPHTICLDWGGRPVEYSPALLTQAIEHILATPRVSRGQSERSEDSDFTGSYIQDLPMKGSFLGWIWKRFIGLMLLGKKSPHVSPQHVPVGPFLHYYERFDAYANRLSGLYRGAFLLNYTLGVLAVILALVGFAARLPIAGQNAPQWIEDAFPVFEGITICYILLILSMLWKGRWHLRNVECRYLGEQFRVMCYLYSLGLTPPHPRLASHLTRHGVQKSWMEWLLRSILRQTPMKHGVYTKETMEAQRSRILQWVRGQAQYHKQNAEKLELIDGRLHKLMWGSLIVILLACGTHLLTHERPFEEIEKPFLDAFKALIADGSSPVWDKVKDEALKETVKLRNAVLGELGLAWWLTALAAGLPALSAACHAIATQGEFERLAEQSKAMDERLEVLAGELKLMGATGSFTFGDLREDARNIAELVVEEVMAWQILYRKPVPPP
jgi:hypothetical protein